MARPKITAILNVHREGLLAVPAIASIYRNTDRLLDAGYEVEILGIMDRSDPLTKSVIESRFRKDVTLIETDFGDAGLARNHAVNVATGDFLGFLDADDLWGADWLIRAADMAQTREASVIWHPEVSIYFGDAKLAFYHIDMEDPRFEPTGLALDNYWTALSFAAHEVYSQNPYPPTDLREGIGFEDWSWNMNTISAGLLHKVVPKTGHAIRRRLRSLSRMTLKADAISHPGDYIKHVIETRDLQMPLQIEQ